MDDFADDKEIQRLRKEQREYEEMIDESISILSRNLFLEQASHRNMKTFFMFKTLEQPILRDSFFSKKENLPVHVSVVDYYSSVRAGKVHSSGRNLYFFGLLMLNREFPLTYISKETLREKIVDIFVNADADYREHRKFSSRFHVVTKDKEKLGILTLNKPLDELARFSEMEAEINGNKCLFRVSRKPVSIKEAENFVKLTNLFGMILGR